MERRCFINGAWTEANSKQVTPVINPATGEKLADVPHCGKEETETAIRAAQTALKPWGDLSGSHRCDMLLLIAARCREKIPELARQLTLEQGKPLQEATAEVQFGVSLIEWFAEQAKRTHGETIVSGRPNHQSYLRYQPVGVCAAITPWNFPFAMITRKVSPALAAGCTIVLKPAPETPLTALSFAAICEEAGLPPGVFNCITGDAEQIGSALMNSPIVRKVSFTGSTEVGKLLIRKSAETVKKLTLELGGNAPYIVFDDADLEKAVQGTLWAKYRNAGQACIGANRFLVQEKVFDRFATRYREVSEKLKVGEGLNDGTDIGPLITTEAVDRIRELVQDALNQGAHLSLGELPAQNTHWVKPIILTGITSKMRIWSEEIFGPVSALRRFSSEDEAVSLANDTEYGLAAYVYSTDTKRCERLTEQLDFGMVGLNDFSFAGAQIPFGGMKQSGFGVEGGNQAIYQYLQNKYVSVGG